jgi:GNAT superfamily N-acetyltransferase
MKETPDVQVKKLIKDDQAQQAYCCMTEVPTPWPEALCQCRDWVAQNLGVHVEGYHLQFSTGQVIGHIYFARSEQALFSYQVEPGVGVLYCEWVQQRYQKQGLGTRLFEAFRTDLEAAEAKGLLVEATDFEGQMHYSHYLSRGFEVIHQDGHQMLLYLPLRTRKIQFQPHPLRIQPQKGVPVEIYLFRGFQCPYEAATHILVREIAQEFNHQVTLQEVWLTPESLARFGVASGVVINGRQKLSGGETERAIRQAIMEEL